MRTVNIHEAKTTLSALIRLVEEEGEEVRIARNGQAVVQLVRVAKNKNPLFQSDPMLKVELFEDPTLPLDPEDWPDSEFPAPK